MDILKLNATLRDTVGKGPARQLRREGKIPAVLYGRNKETVSLTVVSRDLEDILKQSKGGQSLMQLTVENGKKTKRTVMLKELQMHPVNRDYLHADFYEIDMARKIRVNVPVVTVGKSKGVEMGGILQVIRREMEVYCLPKEIPESIEIDVTDLDVGDSVHVEDIRVADSVEIPAEVNFTVVTVVSPKIEALPEEEVAEEEALEGEEAPEGEGEGEAAEGAEAAEE